MAFSTNTGLAPNLLGMSAPLQVSLNGQLQHASETVSGFSDPSSGQHTRTSDQIYPTFHDLIVPESTYPATPNVDDPVHDIADGGPTDDAPTEDAPTDGGPTDGGPTDGGPTDDAPIDDSPTNDAPTNDAPTDDAPIDDAPIDDASIDDAPIDDAPIDAGATDDAPTDSSRRTAAAQFDGQDNDDLANDSLADKELAVTRTRSWVKGDDKEPLSTNPAGQVSSLGEHSCEACWTRNILGLILPFPFRRGLAKGSCFCTPFSADSLGQLSCYDCRRRSIFCQVLPFPIRPGLVEGAYLSCTHFSAEISSQPTPRNHISSLTGPGASQSTCDALTSNGLENTMHVQESTCDVPTRNALTSNGHENIMQELTCDVPTGNGYVSAMEEPTRDIDAVNGRVMTAEEVTWDEGRIPSTSSTWSWGFMRKASDMAGMYGRIKEADSNDEVQDRQDSASSCSVRGCGIIDSLLHIPCKWFQPRSSPDEASHAEPGDTQATSDVHDGSSSSPNQSQAHQGRSAASPLMPRMPDFNRDGYVTFPTLSPPTPSSPLVSRSSEHQKSTPVHHARRGTMKASKFPPRLITVDRILQYASEVPSMQRRRAHARTPMRRARSEGPANGTLASRLVPHKTSQDLDSPEMKRKFDDVD